MPFFIDKDEERRKNVAKKALEEDLPAWFKKAESYLKNQGGQYFVGNKVSKIHLQYNA